MSFCAKCGTELNGAFCSSCGAPAPSVATPPPPAAPTGTPWAPPVSDAELNQMAAPSPYATWIRRVGGSLVDGLVIGVPVAILMGAGIAWGVAGMHWVCTDSYGGNSTNCVTTPGSHFNAGGGVLIALAVLALIGWVIYVILAIGGPQGATVGMRAVKIRCVTDGEFGQLGNGKSFGRYAMAIVFGLIWFVALIDYLFPLWDDKRQTLHDKVVSTVVLYEPDGR